MFTRLLNALGLATYKQFSDLERDWFDNAKMDRKTIEEILTFHDNQKTFLEHKFKEIEDGQGCDCESSIEMINDRLDVLEEEGDGVLTKSNFDIDNHFDIDNYSDEIDRMINNELDYSYTFVPQSDIETMIEDSILEFAKKRMTVEESIEKIGTLCIEKIGGAILGLTHEEPELENEPLVITDPVLRQIIEDKN
jgi:hypothetical protein